MLKESNSAFIDLWVAKFTDSEQSDENLPMMLRLSVLREITSAYVGTSSKYPPRHTLASFSNIFILVISVDPLRSSVKFLVIQEKWCEPLGRRRDPGRR